MHPGPTPYQRAVIWNALTGLAMTTLGALAVGLIWLTAQTVSFLQPVLIPIALAGIIAYLLEPGVKLLARRGLSRAKSVLLVFLGFVLFIAATAAIVIPESLAQAGKLVSQREKITETVKTKFETFFKDHPDSLAHDWLIAKQDATGERQPSKAEAWLQENAGQIAKTTGNVLARGFQGFASILGITIGIFLIPIYLWYFLTESQAIQKNWESFLPLRASRFKRETVETLTEINNYLIAFFRGQMLVSMIDGFLVGITLTIFGLPYGLLIGIFVALLGLLPYVGNLLCWIPAVLISIAHFSVTENQHAWLGAMSTNIWIYPAIVSLIFVGVQQINSFVTAPKIIGDSVGLHPMTVIFSVFFWTLLLGGALGTLLAVPLSASVKVLFSRYIWTRKITREDTPPADTGPGSPPPADTGPAPESAQTPT